MDFLETIERQSESLKKEVREHNRLAFLNIATDGRQILCSGAGNPNKLARCMLNVLNKDEDLKKAFLEEMESDNERKITIIKSDDHEDIKKVLDEIIRSL